MHKWFYHKATCLFVICLEYSLCPQMSVNLVGIVSHITRSHFHGQTWGMWEVKLYQTHCDGDSRSPLGHWGVRIASSQVTSEVLAQPYIYMCSPRREYWVQVKTEGWNTFFKGSRPSSFRQTEDLIQALGVIPHIRMVFAQDFPVFSQ